MTSSQNQESHAFRRGSVNTRTLEEVERDLKRCESIIERIKKEIITWPIGDPQRMYAEAKLEMVKDYQGKLQAEYDMIKSIQVKGGRQ